MAVLTLRETDLGAEFRIWGSRRRPITSLLRSPLNLEQAGAAGDEELGFQTVEHL